MQFDGEISTEVSLSRILDEMLTDGTDREVVVKFLHQHEDDIPDIFRGSDFVYDLYDITLTSELDPFLVKHMEHLRPIDCFFAMKHYAIAHGNKSVHALPELEAAIQNVRQESIFLAEDKWGQKIPWEVIDGDTTIWDYINGMTDERDVRSFLRSNYLSRSLFVAKNFLRLSTSAQFLVITQNVVNGVAYGLSWGSPKSLVRQRVNVHMLISLIRQVLAAGDVEMFNWIANVAGLHNHTCLFSEKFMSEVLSRIPHKSIRDMILPPSWTMPKPAFEEIVFETNMYGGRVDGVDVFLALYFSGKHIESMKKNKDLLEFLSLSFDPSEVEHLKEAKC